MTSVPDPPAPHAGPAGRGRRGWWWVGAVVVLLVAGGVVLAGVLEHRSWVAAVARYDAQVAEQADAAEESLTRVEAQEVVHPATLAAVVVTGRTLLAASEGQVEDPAVREPLQSALDAADALRENGVERATEERTVDALRRPNPFRPATRPARHVTVVTGISPAPAELDDAASAVAASATTVADAQQQWAFDGLQAAATDGDPVLTESAGLVTDEGTRTELAAALAAARTSLDAGVGGVPVAQSVAERDAVTSATEAVWSDRLARTLELRRQQAKDSGIDCTVQPCVALTFDDGPGVETERLLQVLAEKHVPATFFLVGRNVEARPAVARAAAEAGHLLANHTWDHPQLTTLDDEEVRRELERTQEVITNATGQTPDVLRPPYGDVDDRVRSIATRTGLRVVLWNLDTEDWRTRNTDETRRRAVEGARPGSVVLLHDIHASTIDAVPGIIDDLRAQGYLLVTVDQMAP